MQLTKYKFFEFFIIFIIIPVSFVLNFFIWIKMIIGILGFGYVLFILLKVEKQKLKLSTSLNWSLFWKQTLLKLVVISLITTVFVYYTDRSNLFVVLLNKPKLWLGILFFYSFFSVYPQELIYRTFYFKRYATLFKSEPLFIFVNAIVFSLAHLFFKNTLVLVLTFLGGLLFAFTFNKTQSTVLVSIEHALYGCWLFTVGMGDMLGFPT